MTAATVDRHPRLPGRGDNLPSSFGLALVMHALLFGGMTLAVQWRTQPAAPAVAELWSSLPPLQVLPEPIVVPPAPPPPPRPAPEPEREADIALKVEKKAPPKIEPPKEEKKIEPKKPEPKKEEKKVEAKKVEAKKEEPERPRTDLERLMAQAQAAATPGGAPTPGAVVSGVSGRDAGYSALVVGCIRPHIVFVVPEGTGANVYAQFSVELLPDGSVGNVRLVRASGLAGYDAAAERAIRRCDPFPRNREGKVERNLTLTLRPVETR